MRRFWLIIVALFWLSACSTIGQQAAAPPTVTLVPVASATPLPTATPLASVTPVASPTVTLPPSATSPPSATPARSGLIDAVRSVNLRAGPGVGYAPLAALQPGERVTLLAQDAEDSWHQVQLADGREGWVAASLIVRGRRAGAGKRPAGHRRGVNPGDGHRPRQ